MPGDAELSRFWALSPSLLAIAGYDGALRQVNDAWRTSLGWSDQELLGRPLVDLFHPEDRDEVRSATLELTSGSAHVGFEARVAVAGGGWQAYLFSATPAPDGLAYLVGTEFEQRRVAGKLLGAERAVAAVLAEEAGIEQTVARLLRVIGEALDWDVATWWEVDPRAELLRPTRTWQRLEASGEALEQVTAEQTFAAGVDLPGRVWAAGQAAWVEDLDADPAAGRAAAAREAGLRSALALPVGIGPRVTAVIELLSREPGQPPPEMLGALRAIAGQVGLFVERLRAETARRLFAGILESIPEPALAADRDGVILTTNGAVERLYGYRADELLGKPLSILTPPAVAAADRAMLDRVLAGEVIEDYETERLAKDGTVVAVAVTIAPMRDGDGNVVAAGGIHVDVRERRARDEALERALRRLSASTEVLLALGGRTDPDRVLGLIAERGRSLVDARAVLILLARAGELVVSATAGALPDDMIGASVTAAGTLPGESLRTHRLERLADAPVDLGPFLSALRLEAATAMLVPLTFRGDGLGVLLALDRTVGGPEFGREDEHLMVSFAAGAATAVATTRSVEEDLVRASLASAEREHRRWARDLHDQTLQGLHGLQMLLTTALSQGTHDALRGSAEQALEFLSAEIDELRGIITDVRPATLDEIGLQAALNTLLERVASNEQIDVTTDLRLAWEEGEETERLSPELETTIYRCVQEALSNVSRHARAERVHIRVTEDAGQILLEVADDGVGFDPAHRAEGVGLVGMRERIALVGGSLSLESSDGGTALHARMPARHEPR